MSPIVIGIIIYLVVSLIGVIITHTPYPSNRCFDQQWYKNACKEFGEDYTYPQSTIRSIMQANGTIIREERHYKPYRYSTFDRFTDKLEPWFLEILRVDDGRNQFIDREFY